MVPFDPCMYRWLVLGASPAWFLGGAGFNVLQTLQELGALISHEYETSDIFIKEYSFVLYILSEVSLVWFKLQENSS